MSIVSESVGVTERSPAHSRFDYPDDRFQFDCWVSARTPADYFWYDQTKNTLIIELRSGEKRMAYRITQEDLDTANRGWRNRIAEAVRQTRHALRRSRV